MRFSSISIKNFKSFDSFKVNLEGFNVVVGPNAAGKSNFIQAFKFIRDIAVYGLENAIYMQGGPDYLCNFSTGSDLIEFSYSIDAGMKLGIWKKTSKGMFGGRFNNIRHSFSIRFDEQNGFEVESDKLVNQFEIFRIEETNGRLEEKESMGKMEVSVTKKGGKYDVQYAKPAKIDMDVAGLLGFSPGNTYTPPKTHADKNLIIESEVFGLLNLPLRKQLLSRIAIYDFDTKLPKQATTFLGKAELEENGENLAIVLRKILSDQSRRQTMFNLLNDILPFVEELEVDKFFDKYLQIMMKEKYGASRPIPASMMSDGTIMTVLLIIALYFENRPLLIFEETARRLHPQLISGIIEMMKEASQSKQIVLSTHNPEIVKYAGVENLFFVSRNEQGFSKLSRPHQKEEVKTFLQNEIGIEELYIQNLLGA